MIEKIMNRLHNSTQLAADKSTFKIKNHLKIILNDLSEKDLTVKQTDLLDAKLYSLFSEIDFDKISHKELKKKYNELLEFLKSELFLYPEGHHIFSFGFLGFLLGCCLQSLSIIYMKNSFLSFYSCFILMFIGIFIGAICDSTIKKQGRTLKSQYDF